MAITFVNGWSATGGATTSLSIDTSTGTQLQVGDVMLLFVAYYSGANQTGPGASWTQIVNPWQNTTSATYCVIWRKVATAGDIGATVSVSWDVAAYSSGGILAFRGVNTTTPEDAKGTGDVADTTTSISASSISPTSSNDVLCWFAGTATTDASSGSTVTAPSGFVTDVWDISYTNGTCEGSVASYQLNIASGATGAKAGTASTNMSYNAVLVALQPAAVVTIPPPALRHRQQKKRVPLVKPKPRLKNKWISERQVTAPHADRPYILRKLGQKRRIPKITPKPPVRNRFITEEIHTPPHADFPPILRHRQQTRRVPRIKAKPQVHQRFIVEQIHTPPHADFPEQIRRRGQTRRIPRIKAKAPVRNRLIDERAVTAPPAIFSPQLRHRQQPHRIPKIRTTRLNKNRVELTVPAAVIEIQPRPLQVHNQKHRIPRVTAKRPLRSNLTKQWIPQAPIAIESQPVRHRRGQTKRIPLVKAKHNVVRSSIQLRIPQPTPIPGLIFARKHPKRIPQLKAKRQHFNSVQLRIPQAPLATPPVPPTFGRKQVKRVPLVRRKRALRHQIPLVPGTIAPPLSARHRGQLKRVPQIRAKRPLRANLTKEILQPVAPHADFPPILRHQQQKRRIPRVRLPRLVKNRIELTIPQAPTAIPPPALRHRQQAKRIPRISAKRRVFNSVQLRIPQVTAPGPPRLPTVILVHNQKRRIPNVKAKRPLRSNLTKQWIPQAPHADFPNGIRRQQQKKRIPLLKAKPRVFNRWISERQVSAPHADFPSILRRPQLRKRVPSVKAKRPVTNRLIDERLVSVLPALFPPAMRHPQQKRRIPHVKAKRPVTNRLIDERLVTPPHADFPPALRHRQQARRIPRVLRTRLNKNHVEITLPATQTQTLPRPISVHNQKRRIPRINAKRPLRSNLSKQFLPQSPHPDLPPAMRHRRGQAKRLALVKPKHNVVRSSAPLRILPLPAAAGPTFGRKQTKRLPRVTTKRRTYSSVQLRIPGPRGPITAIPFLPLFGRRQLKHAAHVKAKRPLRSNLNTQFLQPIDQPTVRPLVLRKAPQRRRIPHVRLPRLNKLWVQLLTVPAPVPRPPRSIFVHKQAKRIPATRAKRVVRSNLELRIPQAPLAQAPLAARHGRSIPKLRPQTRAKRRVVSNLQLRIPQSPHPDLPLVLHRVPSQHKRLVRVKAKQVTRSSIELRIPQAPHADWPLAVRRTPSQHKRVWRVKAKPVTRSNIELRIPQAPHADRPLPIRRPSQLKRLPHIRAKKRTISNLQLRIPQAPHADFPQGIRRRSQSKYILRVHRSPQRRAFIKFTEHWFAHMIITDPELGAQATALAAKPRFAGIAQVRAVPTALAAQSIQTRATQSGKIVLPHVELDATRTPSLPPSALYGRPFPTSGYIIAVEDNGKIIALEVTAHNRTYLNFTGATGFMIFENDFGTVLTRPATFNPVSQQWEYSTVAGEFVVGHWRVRVAVTFANGYGPIYSSPAYFNVVMPP